MIRKIFALLALVGLAAAPSTGWAGSYSISLTAKAVLIDGAVGSVAASKSQSFATYSEAEKADDSYSATILVYHDFKLYASAKAGEGSVFIGWFDNESCTGNPIETKTTYTYSERVYNKGASSKTVYAKFVKHEHSFAYSISGDKITKTCTAEGCPGSVGGTATLTIPASTTYSAAPHAASLQTMGDASAALSYSCGSAPTAVGNYTVTMTVDGGTAANSTITRDLIISPATIDSVSFNPASQNYDGAAKSTTMTVKAGNLTLGSGDYDIISGVLSGVVGSPAGDTVTTVTVRGKGNFQGEKDGTWTIKAPGTDYKLGTCTSQGAYGTVSDGVLTINQPTELAYNGNGTWSAKMKVEVPVPDNYTFIRADYLHFQNANYEGAFDDSNDTAKSACGLEVTYSKSKVTGRDYKYITDFSWTATIALEEVQSATAPIERTLKVWSPAWSDQGFLSYDNNGGLRETTYKIIIPIENLKLNDQFGNQVYPDAGYVAQVGNIKYQQLADAISVANAGDDKTVNLIGNAEAGTFSVGKNVTVNLGGFGNESATYKFVNLDDDNLGARVSSEKAENVTTDVVGFGVDADGYTYRPVRRHLHSWSYALNGDTLTATCVTDDGTQCDQNTVTVQLTVSGAADGVAPTASLGADAELFKSLTGASFGTVGYVRDTDDGAACAKWYVGDYTAQVEVTVGGTTHTLAKAFSIAKPSGGYTSGYEVGAKGVDAAKWVRYDSWGEAVAAATKGDTIYYREGDFNQETVDFSTDKGLTLDLCGKTVKYSSNDGDMTIQNLGAGTLTLLNAKIEQPKNIWAHNIIVKGADNGGKFVFGEGVSVENHGDYNNTHAPIKTSGISLNIAAGGLYDVGSLDEGVTVTGGTFGTDFKALDGFDPSARVPNCGDDYVVCKIADKKYEVVVHTHVLNYAANGNVIAVRCDGEDSAWCSYRPSAAGTLTLTAEDRKVAGSPYAGAKVTVAGKFPVTADDVAIEFYKDNVKLSDAPTDSGEYEARVTLTGEDGKSATAVAPFSFFHEHQYAFALAGNTLTATCGAAGSCDKQAATVVLDVASRDWQKGTVLTASVADDFGDVIDHAVGDIVYKQDGVALAGAPKLTGSYTAEVTVTVDGQPEPYTLTKAFSITKPAGGYTSGYEVGATGVVESKWVSYDTWAEAVAAAQDEETIYWHEGDWDTKTYDFTSDKNITVDFGKATLKHTEAEDLQIVTKGTGTVTLKNVTVQQPQKVVADVGVGAADVKFGGLKGGKFVLGEGFFLKNVSWAGNYPQLRTGGITIDNENYENISVEITAGDYQIEKLAGKVNVTGGRFWECKEKSLEDHVDGLGHTYVIREISDGDYVSQVVPHTHAPTAVVSGSAIVVSCTAPDHEWCAYGSYSATLSATGKTYDGQPCVATVTKTAGYPEAEFPVELAYYKNDEKQEQAPVDAGDYVARMKVGELVVEQGFTIDPATIDALTLVAETFYFDGAEKANSVASVKAGELDATYSVSGDALTQTGSIDGTQTYAVKVSGTGNFTGELEQTWQIVAPTGEVSAGEELVQDGVVIGTFSGTTLTLTQTTGLLFADNAWTLSVPFNLPADVSSVTYTEGEDVTVAAGALTWKAKITLDAVAAAISAQQDFLTLELSVQAFANENSAGLKPTTCVVKIPLTNLVLAVPAGQTLAAGDAAISGYKLLLGKGAKVTASEKVAGFRTVIVPQEKSEIVKESGNGPYTYSAVNKGLMILFGIGQ